MLNNISIKKYKNTLILVGFFTENFMEKRQSCLKVTVYQITSKKFVKEGIQNI